MFGAILKAKHNSFQKGMPFCRSIYVKKVMKLLAFIFEQPSYVFKLRYNQNCPFLVQGHISDFQEPCVFCCFIHCFKRRQRKRG